MSYSMGSIRPMKKLQEISDVIKILTAKNFRNDTLYIMVPPHTGDVYALCSLVEEIKKKSNISRVAIVCHRKYRDLVFSFPGVDEMVECPQWFSEYLPWFKITNPLKINELKPGSLVIANPGIVEKIVRFDDKTFWDFFRYQLGISVDTKFSLPQSLKPPSEGVIELIEKYKNFDKILYLFPSSRAIKLTVEIENVVRKVVEELISLGWLIVTNDLPDYLKGMDLVLARLSFTDVIHYANYCKRVLAVRNGIVDILNASNARIVVLYPSQKTTHLVNKTEIIRYFSLNNFETRANIREYVVRSDGKIITDIKSFLGSEI